MGAHSFLVLDSISPGWPDVGFWDLFQWPPPQVCKHPAPYKSYIVAFPCGTWTDPCYHGIFRRLVLGLLDSHNHMSHLPNKKTTASDTSKAGIIYLCINILYKCGTCEWPYDQEKGNIGHDKWYFSSSRNNSRWNLGSIQMSKLCWNWIYGCEM